MASVHVISGHRQHFVFQPGSGYDYLAILRCLNPHTPCLPHRETVWSHLLGDSVYHWRLSGLHRSCLVVHLKGTAHNCHALVRRIVLVSEVDVEESLA